MKQGHFNPETHTYTINGRKVPSVTQVVRQFAPFPVQVDPWYLQRGQMVHKACALMVDGALDFDSVDSRIQGRVFAARGWLRAFGDFQTWIIEHPAYDKQGQFAGTPDLWINHCLVDWKCTADAATEIQLGGYCSLMDGQNCSTRKCFAVELHEDGTWKQTEYTPKRCIGLWRAALSVWQWQEANGYHKQNERD